MGDKVTPAQAFRDWGGRRFIMSMGCGMVTTALLVNGYVTDGVYATVILGTIGAFITGNVTQKVAGHDS